MTVLKKAMTYIVDRAAELLGAHKAARAVGNAIGANPVALLIPCHRVIQQSGALGSYRWGPAKKLMVQTWETATLDEATNVALPEMSARV